jgi:hypothetical protein
MPKQELKIGADVLDPQCGPSTVVDITPGGTVQLRVTASQNIITRSVHQVRVNMADDPRPERIAWLAIAIVAAVALAVSLMPTPGG